MVGWSAVPSVPMAEGSPATLLTTMTAAAPPVWALRTLTVKAHAPRRTTTMRFVKESAAKGSQAVVGVVEPPATGADSGAVRSVCAFAKPPAATRLKELPVTASVTVAPTKWGTLAAPAVRALAGSVAARAGAASLARPARRRACHGSPPAPVELLTPPSGAGPPHVKDFTTDSRGTSLTSSRDGPVPAPPRDR